MKTEGIVKEINDKNIAVISCMRESACDSCHKKEEGSCSVCSLMGAGKTMEIRVKNSLHAAVGDRVEVESETRRVLFYAGLTFIVPIILPILCYFIAFRISGKEALSALIGVLAAVIYFLVLRLVSEKVLGSNRGSDVVMTRVIPAGEDVRKTDETENTDEA